MKKSNLIIFIFLTLIYFSCDKDEILSGASLDASLVKLDLEADKVYSTIIDGHNLSLNTEISYLEKYLIIKEIKIAENATASCSVGDTIFIQEGSYELNIVAQDTTIKNTYNLKLTRDLGLSISPNIDLGLTSSYNLQLSDFYIQGGILTNDWSRMHINGYADFNQDGFTDIIISTGLFKQDVFSPVYLFLNDGSNNFAEAQDYMPADFAGMKHPRKILIGDYNNDLKMDAYLIGHGYDADPFPGEIPVLLLNSGNGFEAISFSDHVSFFHGGASADIDNDGDVDIFSMDGSGKSFFLINDGAANFTSNTDRLDNSYLDRGGYYTAELIDIDLDGFMDLIIAGHEHEGAPTTILWGNSYGKYFEKLSTEIPANSEYSVVVDIDAEDIDNDGDQDIILSRVNTEYSAYYIQILENTDTRTFSDQTPIMIPDNVVSGKWYHWIHVQDIDNDGDWDIITEDMWHGSASWTNDGLGVFSKIN